MAQIKEPKEPNLLLKRKRVTAMEKQREEVDIIELRGDVVPRARGDSGGSAWWSYNILLKNRRE